MCCLQSSRCWTETDLSCRSAVTESDTYTSVTRWAIAVYVASLALVITAVSRSVRERVGRWNGNHNQTHPFQWFHSDSITLCQNKSGYQSQPIPCNSDPFPSVKWNVTVCVRTVGCHQNLAHISHCCSITTVTVAMSSCSGQCGLYVKKAATVTLPNAGKF